MKKYPRFAEAAGPIAAPAATVFEFLDGQTHLASHMSGLAWKVVGTNLSTYMDGNRTRTIGSKFGFKGRILGLPLSLDEVVTSRDPGLRKTWKTCSLPKLWVIGAYVMGFELTPRPGGTVLRVFMEYLPTSARLPRVMRLWLADAYARWCTRRMVRDARAHLDSQYSDRLPGSKQDEHVAG